MRVNLQPNFSFGWIPKLNEGIKNSRSIKISIVCKKKKGVEVENATM